MNTREKLACYAHLTWARWVKTQVEKFYDNDTGKVIIPKSKVDSWIKQMNTSYLNLSEDEKDLDREEADKILEIING